MARTDKSHHGFGHPVGEKPGEILGGFLRVAGKINTTKICTARTVDEPDSGRFIKDGKKNAGGTTSLNEWGKGRGNERVGRTKRGNRGGRGDASVVIKFDL